MEDEDAPRVGDAGGVAGDETGALPALVEGEDVEAEGAFSFCFGTRYEIRGGCFPFFGTGSERRRASCASLFGASFDAEALPK